MNAGYGMKKQTPDIIDLMTGAYSHAALVSVRVQFFSRDR